MLNYAKTLQKNDKKRPAARVMPKEKSGGVDFFWG